WCVLAMGFAPAGGCVNLGLSVLLTWLIVWALIWIFIALATWLRNIEMLSSIGFLVTFPLMFASSAFVPIDVLPRWLQVVAIVNPVTYAVNASRALSLDWPDAGLLSLAALLTGGVLIALAMTVAVRKFATPWGEGWLRPPAPPPHHRHDHGHHHDREHDQPRVAEGLLDPADRCAGQGAGRHIHRGPRVGTTQRGGEEETVSHFRHARG